jgi:hypothetical protein
VTRYAVTGTLAFPGGPTFDLGACRFQVRLTKTISNVPSSQLKTGGKAPANDAPDGAEVLKVPGSATAQTGGAHDAEVPMDCVVVDEGTPVDAFRTVWYRVTGTGRTITVDTAGSKFDTVIEVYTASGGTFTPVPDTCVDDVPAGPVGRTLQAAVSWPTTAGVTYYVQIGGFPDDLNWGTLKVRAS